VYLLCLQDFRLQNIYLCFFGITRIMNSLLLHFRRSFWAEGRSLSEFLTYADNIGLESIDIQKILYHLEYMLKVYPLRFAQEESSHIQPWLEPDHDAFKNDSWSKMNSRFAQLFIDWDHLLMKYQDELDHIFSFRISNGQEMQSRFSDVMTHILTHSHYHKSEINQILKSLELKPFGFAHILFVE
jgi:uncharacterized damage-inducible protein DinB